eukprot:6187981-Pleurochrysis_carterae.AAC.1
MRQPATSRNGASSCSTFAATRDPLDADDGGGEASRQQVVLAVDDDDVTCDVDHRESGAAFARDGAYLRLKVVHGVEHRQCALHAAVRTKRVAERAQLLVHRSRTARKLAERRRVTERAVLSANGEAGAVAREDQREAARATKGERAAMPAIGENEGRLDGLHRTLLFRCGGLAGDACAELREARERSRLLAHSIERGPLQLTSIFSTPFRYCSSIRSPSSVELFEVSDCHREPTHTAHLSKLLVPSKLLLIGCARVLPFILRRCCICTKSTGCWSALGRTLLCEARHALSSVTAMSDEKADHAPLWSFAPLFVLSEKAQKYQRGHS